ncbi:hypothetical protein [Rubrivirga sp.]|uniref:hypothetical protein n=1 Tax=Rubrivirga sp. TaxID=1885344 RepID=UPI003B5207A0
MAREPQQRRRGRRRGSGSEPPGPRSQSYITEDRGGGKLADCGLLLLDEERVEAEWYLWEGDRPNIGPYAKQNGYIAIRYNGELFHVTSRKIEFRWFGIIEKTVQDRVTIILEPRHFKHDGMKWGVHPDQSRSRLIFTGDGEKGVEVPLSDWGYEFAEVMPEPIREAVMAARGDLAGSIDDDEYRKRLQDKFGDRWTTRKLVVSPNGKGDKEVAPPTGEEDMNDAPPGGGGGGRSRSRQGSRSTKKVRLRTTTDAGPLNGRERERPVDVPRYAFRRADDFEKDWHLATYIPNDPEGPTVYINLDSGILQEVIEYHQERYPEVLHEEVAGIVKQVFGEVAACKVAHAQRLTKEIPEQELNKSYRNEEALTIGLMGLIAEEAVISQRVGRLGKKKAD